MLKTQIYVTRPQCVKISLHTEGDRTVGYRRTKYKILYAFFWVIPPRLNFICRRFGTLCLFHLHRRIGVEIFYTYPTMKMEQTECTETSEYKIQTPGNYSEESIQHSEHGESLKSRSIKSLDVAQSFIIHAGKENFYIV